MTDHDFTELLNTARAKGFVARMLHPLVLVITTPEYVAAAPALAGETTAEQLIAFERDSAQPNGVEKAPLTPLPA